MKIHFCDLCNESVPQGDLDQGRAFVRKGRVICATCDRAMSHAHPATALGLDAGSGASAAGPASAGPATAAVASDTHSAQSLLAQQPAGPAAHAPLDSAPPITPAAPAIGAHAPHAPVSAATRSGGGAALWLGALALVFAAGATFVLDDHIQSQGAKQDTLEKALDKATGSIALVDRRVQTTDESQRDLEKRLGVRIDAQKTRYATLDEEAARVRKAQDGLSTRLAEIAKSVAELQEKSGTPSLDLEKRLSELSARLAKGEDEQRALKEQIAALQAAAAAQAQPVAVEPPKPAEAAWKATIPELSNPNESVRWEAVTTLGATNDPEVVPYIVPMLKDSNVFVRMAAARMLGNLQAKPAVNALIDALEDVEAAVREQAFVALRAVTSRDLKFDPLANDAERAKRVKAWREWWKKESETPSGT